MTRRKVFEKQVFDMETGKIYSEEFHYVSGNEETFGMHRTTEGVDWIFNFTGVELQMLIVLLEIEDLKTGIINMTPMVRQHVCDKFGKTDRYIREIIHSLCEKDALLKITSQDLILNPIHMYKGGTKVFKNKYHTYLAYKEQKDNGNKQL